MFGWLKRGSDSSTHRTVLLANLYITGPLLVMLIIGVLSAVGLAFIDFYYMAKETIPVFI